MRISVKFQISTSIDVSTFEKIEEFVELKIFKTKAAFIRESIKEYLRKHNTDIIAGKQKALTEFANNPEYL